MQQTVDLHTHSCCSDGTFSPTELVLLAKQKGLSAIALTDHDTADGIAEFLKAGEFYGIETIGGMEFAALWPKYHHPEIHIVGLGIDCHAPALLHFIENIQQSRVNRNIHMAENLTRIGLPVSLEEVTNNAGGKIITRAHFANVLLEKGMVSDRKTAFARYLSPGCPGYVLRDFPTPKACIETIKKSGGAAILAHPTLYGLDTEELSLLCEELVSYGLDGMECYYTTFTPKQTAAMKKIAETYALLPSGGSDFHGKNKPNIQLGTGLGNLSLPYSLWENLKKRTSLSK